MIHLFNLRVIKFMRAKDLMSALYYPCALIRRANTRHVYPMQDFFSRFMNAIVCNWPKISLTISMIIHSMH